MLSNLLDSNLTDEPVPFAPPQWINIVAVVSLSITSFLAVYIYLGLIIGLLFLLSAILAFILWLAKGYVQPISRRVIPVFVLLIIVNLIMGGEHMAGSYAPNLAALFPHLVTPANAMTNFTFVTVFPLTSTSIWLLTGALVFYQVRLGGYLVIFLAMWSIVFPIANAALPLIASSEFTGLPGNFSAIFVIIAGAMTLQFIYANPTYRETSK